MVKPQTEASRQKVGGWTELEMPLHHQEAPGGYKTHSKTGGRQRLRSGFPKTILEGCRGR